MIRQLRETDIAPLTEIYNHYVRTSTATFETEPLTEGQMHLRLIEEQGDYPCFVHEENGIVIGYGALHKFRPRFDHVAEATIYYAPEATARGFGAEMLARLIDEGRKMPMLNGIIACINATNTPSRRLAERFGFRMVGIYEKVGYKFGQWLDDVDYELLF